MKEKSSPLLGCLVVGLIGFDAGRVLGAVSKKLPPLSGGGEVT